MVRLEINIYEKRLKRFGFWRYTKYFYRIYVSKELRYWNCKLKAGIEYLVYYLQ